MSITLHDRCHVAILNRPSANDRTSLLVLAGSSGSGKSTAARILANYLRSLGETANHISVYDRYVQPMLFAEGHGSARKNIWQAVASESSQLSIGMTSRLLAADARMGRLPQGWCVVDSMRSAEGIQRTRELFDHAAFVYVEAECNIKITRLEERKRAIDELQESGSAAGMLSAEMAVYDFAETRSVCDYVIPNSGSLSALYIECGKVLAELVAQICKPVHPIRSRERSTVPSQLWLCGYTA